MATLRRTTHSTNLLISRRRTLRANPASGPGPTGPVLGTPVAELNFATGVYKLNGVVTTADHFLSSTTEIAAGVLLMDAADAAPTPLNELLAQMQATGGFTIVLTMDFEDANPDGGYAFNMYSTDFGNVENITYTNANGDGGPQGSLVGTRRNAGTGDVASVALNVAGNQFVKMAWSFSAAGVFASAAGGEVQSDTTPSNIGAPWGQVSFASPGAGSHPADDGLGSTTFSYLAVYALQDPSFLPTLSA
jgi:hypothetical protein